ncbi:MAG TPA: alcohol dehydrogenase catalytic domain-containing protein, partial [Cryobacterium sp.]|nr:alcohol dehydrogenase catalytic domain-containing protein [Cryobacterium sp.]
MKSQPDKSQPDTRTHGQDVRMRAAVYRRFGPPEVVHVEDVPKPLPGPGEVLVKVYASTVSAADYRSRSRTVPKGLALPVALALGVFRPRKRVLGMDVAGVVEAVGADVTSFGPGDEVIAMLGSRFGGHAEYVCVPQDGAITAKPRNMTFAEAVTLVFGGTTAHDYLSRAVIKPGSTVLVNGASGA